MFFCLQKFSKIEFEEILRLPSAVLAARDVQLFGSDWCSESRMPFSTSQADKDNCNRLHLSVSFALFAYKLKGLDQVLFQGRISWKHRYCSGFVDGKPAACIFEGQAAKVTQQLHTLSTQIQRFKVRFGRYKIT